MAQTTKQVQLSWYQSSAARVVPLHSGIYKLHLQAKATLDSTVARESVKLPPGIDKDEWIAAQMLSIFEEVCNLAALLDNLCDESSCPRMSAGKYVHYSWADETQSMPRPLSAPVYRNTLLTYAESHLSNRSLLPVDGSPFPTTFRPMMATICKRFFRVYAHAYLSHFEPISEGGCEAHLNFCFKHFLCFVLEFDLVQMSDMQPLAQLIQSFTAPKEDEEEATMQHLAQ